MKIRTENGITIITAEDGMIFRRISDGHEFGNEIWLGKAYAIGGVKLETPIQELPEHFEEIPMPEDYLTEETYDEEVE
jgi:hypothetical protein